MSSEKAGGELFVIAGPSGSGKTSLIAALMQRCPQLALSVSDTTRPARAGELDGQHYHFVQPADFAQGVAAGAYLEHAEVFGNRYGTRRARVEALWQQGRDVLLEIDVQGAEQIRHAHAAACTIFILPPSLEILAARLRGRASDDEAVIARRLGEAQREIDACRNFGWLVINDDFQTAVDELQAIVQAWPLRFARRQAHVDALLDDSGEIGTIGD